MRRLLLFLAIAGAGIAALSLASGGFLGAGSDARRPEVQLQPIRPATGMEDGKLDLSHLPSREPVSGILEPTGRVRTQGPAVPRTWEDPVTGTRLEFPLFVPWEFEAERVQGVHDPETGEQGIGALRVHLRLYRDPSSPSALSRAEAEALHAGGDGHPWPLHMEVLGEEARADFLRLGLHGTERLPGVRTFVHLTKGVVLTDFQQGLVIHTAEAVIDLDTRTAEGSSRLEAETPDWALTGTGFRLQERPSRLEILEQTAFDVRRMAGAAAPEAPGPFDLGSGPFQPTTVTARGSAVVTREPGPEASHQVVLSDDVRVLQESGRSLSADRVTLHLVKRGTAAPTPGSAAPAGGRPSSLRLRRLVAEGHVAIESPAESDKSRPTSLSAPKMVCEFPESGLGTTTFLGRTVLSFTGDLSSPGGKAAPGTVTATCEDALVYGPPPEGMPDIEAVLSLAGSAHVASLSEGDERPQTLDADSIRLFLKRRPPLQRPAPGVAAAASPRSSPKAVAFEAHGHVRLDGPRVLASAETLRGSRMDLPDYEIVAEGRGAHVELVQAPPARAAARPPGRDPAAPQSGDAKAAKARREWVPETLLAETGVRARIAGGGRPVLLTGRSLSYARGKRGVLEAAPGERAKAVLDEGGEHDSFVVAPHLEFDVDSPERTITAEGDAQRGIDAQFWLERRGDAARRADAPREARPAARFALSSGSRIVLDGLSGAGGTTGMRVRLYDGASVERLEGKAATDRIEARTVEATLFERVVEPQPKSAPLGRERPAGTAPATATAAPGAKHARSADAPSPWSLHSTRRLALAFRDESKERGQGLSALSSLDAEGGVEAHDARTRLVGERLTYDGATAKGHLVGEPKGAARVALGTGNLTQRLSSPDVTFGVAGGAIETARFSAPFAGVFHHAADKTKAVEQYVITSKDGDLMVEKTGATVDAGAGKVVVARSLAEGAAKEPGRSERITTSKLSLFAAALLASGPATFDRMVAEGRGTELEVLEAGKDPVRAQGDRVVFDRVASLVTVSAAAGGRVYLVSPEMEGDFRELRYDPATGLWDLPGAFVRLEGRPK